MRSTTNMPERSRMPLRRLWVIAALLIVLLLIVSIGSLATTYTNYLWFNSVHLTQVFDGLMEIKLVLAIIFIGIFFAALLTSWTVADSFAPKFHLPGPEDELISRYRVLMNRRGLLIRIIISFLVALVIGSRAIGEWKAWILFSNAQRFPATDPQFHHNIGYYIFTLPFESFLVGWAFLALVVIFILTVIVQYLNGGIRPQGPAPRLAPQVKAQISVILGLMAADKAVGYYLQRFTLNYSQLGIVEGVGYTDVHARIPAITLLFWISIISCIVFIINVQRKGWLLPVLGVGLWAFIAFSIGVIYPTLLAKLKVDPAQSVLEEPYIARNIAATRTAYNLTKIKEEPFADSHNLTAATASADAQTLSDVRLWDPSMTADTYQKLQDIRSYYHFTTLAVDRYTINGVLTPVIIGVRQVNSNNLPAQSWVNKHLQYTHGYGAIVSPANLESSDGNPEFDIQDVPLTVASGSPTISNPQVYYGPDSPGYVVANTRQPELDYQLPNGTNVEGHYKGTGGVVLNSVWRRMAFAIRFSNLNLLISNLITSHSRIMFERGILTRVEKAAPFLKFGSNVYPVIMNGNIYWVVNGYTTSTHYPYSQPFYANGLALPPSLQQPINYIRNSVKVTINAYNGKMTFYEWDPSDPIIRAYAQAFPHMFVPASKMSSTLRQHLRYPVSLLSIQSSMFGRYHITNASAFYSAGDAWSLAQQPGSTVLGSSSQNNGNPPARTAVVFGQSGSAQRMQPSYEVMSLPGQSDPNLDLLEPFVPLSKNDQIQTLAGFIVAESGPRNYGHLIAYVTPRGKALDGPALIDSRIKAVASISREISLLNVQGSRVSLGSVMMVPIGQSILYVRPLYVAASNNALPELKKVIVVYGKNAAMEDTLPEALSAVLHGPVLGVTPSSTSSSSTTSSALNPTVQQLLKEEASLYNQAIAALKAGNLGEYQNFVNQIGDLTEEALKVYGGGSPGKSTQSTSSKSSSGTSKRSVSSSGSSGSSTSQEGTTLHSSVYSPSSSSSSSGGGGSGNGSGGQPPAKNTNSPGSSSGSANNSGSSDVDGAFPRNEA